MSREQSFPIGAAITVDELRTDPYPALHRLRANEPVSWLPALNAWLVTRRDLAVEAMRDAERFTVDDPRFSTAAVLGESMLSLDGPEHERHRTAFSEHFRPTVVRERFEELIDRDAAELVAGFAGESRAELRAALAGPLAVTTITRFLGMSNVEPTEVLSWYNHIADAIVGVATGTPPTSDGRAAIAAIHQRVGETLTSPGPSLLHEVSAAAILHPEEIPSATAVLMFGAIETSEGMTANAMWHLLNNPEILAAVKADRDKVGPAIEESLRLEPAAAVVDRYTTVDAELGSVTIPKGELVELSLLGANRDPEVFDDPDLYRPDRQNLRQHVTFVQGPHGCIGLHLARLETVAAINAVLDRCHDIELDKSTSAGPEGLIFRKPPAVVARWKGDATSEGDAR